MYDLVICRGEIYDGSGQAPFRADLGIVNGKIAAVGAIDYELGKEIINAAELAVAPGFIDLHSHSGLACLDAARNAPKLFQGVTTEVVGQDGFGAAPVPPRGLEQWRRHVGSFDGTLDRKRWTWESFHDYRAALEGAALVQNVAPLVGHGNLRYYVMGLQDRPSSSDELHIMQTLLESALEAGALGLSTGLVYEPCRFAQEWELLALCKTLSKFGRPLFVHMRNEGAGVLAAVEEVIGLAQKNGIPLHISHLKVMGKRTQALVRRVLDRITAAAAEGLDVTFDQYPYPAVETYLRSLLPPWALQGSPADVKARLLDPRSLRRIGRDIERGRKGWVNRAQIAGWERIYLSAVQSRRHEALCGQTLATIADRWGVPPVEAVCRLLLDEDLEGMILATAMTEPSVRLILRHPLGRVASDGILVGANPHPRTYGTYPRVLGHYARDHKTIPLPVAIAKMTSLPARRLGLADRGAIKVGHWADLVVFNPRTVADKATFAGPPQYPKGIEFVIVNGQVAALHGKWTRTRAGRVL